MNDDKADWTEAWALFPGNVAYVWHAGLHAGTVADSLATAGLVPRSQIIWAKNQMVMSRGITGSTSAADMPSARASRAVMMGTASRPPSGRSISPRGPKPATPPKSPSSA